MHANAQTASLISQVQHGESELISPQLPPTDVASNLPVSQATDLGVVLEGEALRHPHAVSRGVLWALPSSQADVPQLDTADKPGLHGPFGAEQLSSRELHVEHFFCVEKFRKNNFKYLFEGT